MHTFSRIILTHFIVVTFSSQLGIPTFHWYLTGYILCQAGAEFLLQSLPVVGPVDSWIGLKMANNWDNHFWEVLGIGTQPLATRDFPASSELCRIMQFRAFCALNPLCSQKVGAAAVPSTGSLIRRNWHVRDTDIEFSCDKAPDKVGL